ncbi:MAG TPA: antitoxin family protein [Thermoanaerobaculia bacterium]|jgi:predicted DNA-binding antitoxin AbrB/MazE fold protein|nr:antitoxin family protein [Thermoanaerobaculia bacterium]
MTTTIEAVFDGEVLRPDRPLNLEANTRVTLVVTTPDTAEPAESFLDTAMSINLEGPADWSENLDRYLYESRLATNG